MVWQSGQSLYGDRYTILKPLGKGGFGITYLARDAQGQQVVIKTLKDEVMTDPDYADYRDKYLRDFKDEALSLAVCRHPHIVQIENVFHDQGLPCIVMEYVAGLDLGQWLKQRGPLSEAVAVRYVQQVGAGLSVVHSKGRLHRDLKPQNIMVRSATDEAVLIDFGIAREFIPQITQTHTRTVTDGFAPIEQYRERSKRGEFTDVYGLAATLSMLISGEIPPLSWLRLDNDFFESPRNCSAPVRVAIERGMALRPEERSQTMAEWLTLLPKFEHPDIAPSIQVPPTPQTQPPEPDSQILETLQVFPKLQILVRYQQLAKLLNAGDWKGADQETVKQMLTVANRTKEGWLDYESIDNFPSEDLRAIDQLWVYYSSGHFGFSVQKRIYQALGGTREYDREVWRAFGDRVGWRKQGSWSHHKDLNFHTSTTEGHLPFFMYDLWFDCVYLLSRPDL